MADRIQVFAVEAISEAGEKEVIAQIHLACDRCEPVVLVIPGHHVRQVRDVLIDLLDQFPYLVDGGRTVRSTTERFTIDAAAAKKASDN
jgi:hypothetical protein